VAALAKTPEPDEEEEEDEELEAAAAALRARCFGLEAAAACCTGAGVAVIVVVVEEAKELEEAEEAFTETRLEVTSLSSPKACIKISASSSAVLKPPGQRTPSLSLSLRSVSR